MNVILDAIQFCHDPTSAAQSGLPLKWDATREVVLPEWRRSECVGAEDSPVAYAISETKGHTITIKARFRRMVPGHDALEIRAIDPAFPSCDWLTSLFDRVGLDRLPPSNVLGEVAPSRVSFGSNGLSELETFELVNTRFEELGAGVWTTTWQWQYRQPRGSWVNFDRSEHRTYLLLEPPKEPWTQISPPALGLSLPRVDALEYACRWAQGSRTRSEAAAGITNGLYRVGPDLLRYDRPGGGGSYYSSSLTLLLDRLRGGEGNGAYVNCEDCAYIVTTLGNLLGCELWSCPIYDHDSETNPLTQIAINPIIVIGDSDWGFPFPEQGEAFRFHQVAFDGEATVDDCVFDACLMVDADKNPTKTSPYRTPMIPAGIRFAKAKGMAYRERFAAPAGRGCRPDNTWRIRWLVEPFQGLTPSVSPVIRQIARLREWRGRRAPGADILFFPFDMTGDEIPGWRTIRVDKWLKDESVPYIQLLMEPEHGRAGCRLRVEAWQFSSRVLGHDYLAELLGRLEGGPPRPLEPATIGDLAFASANGYFLAFARGNLVVCLRNSGLQLERVHDAAMALDRWLIHRPDPTSDLGSASPTLPTTAEATIEPTGCKYFADRGELSLRNGKPILQGNIQTDSRVLRVGLGPSSQHIFEFLHLDSNEEDTKPARD